MSNEMIDRVAKELCHRFKDKVAAHAGMTFEETGVAVPNQEIWIDYARTAVRALREPSEEMMIAAEKVEPQLECFLPKNESPSYLVWCAMIDEILRN